MTKDGVVSFDSMYNYLLNNNNVKGSCFVQAVGTALQQIHETVEDDFGRVIMYASETTSNLMFPNGRSWMDNADIGAKRMVQATTLKFIFPEKDPNEYEPIEWLSNSTYMPYINAYLTGLDLNSSFSYAGECIGHSFGLVDKVVQLQNNVSYTLNYTKIEDIRLSYPLLNFTGMLAYYIAPLPIDCFEFWVQYQFYWEDLYNKMGNNLSVFL